MGAGVEDGRSQDRPPAPLRPCAMVVPDFELICEIMLVAEGFLEARLLARKFITLYTLCKELLSKQVCDCPGAHGAGGGRDDKCRQPGLPPRWPEGQQWLCFSPIDHTSPVGNSFL